MAICSVLLGGITGFLSGLVALIFVGVPALTALMIYIAVGLGTSLSVMLFAVASSHLQVSDAELPQDLQHSADHI